MPEIHPGEYAAAKELMELMVESSQRPGEGDTAFVENVGSYLSEKGLSPRTIQDPDYLDRQLLVVDFGDPKGEQSLVAVSHADVVGVTGQDWYTDPWSLTESNGIWSGRGVCDTHGSGVAMLVAGARKSVVEDLGRNNKHVSVIFTHDEEAPSAEMSYRGAKLAAGVIGDGGLITAKYFVDGEPTEFDGRMVPMRAHKGRWLMNFTVEVERPGHSAQDVQNALTVGAELAHEIVSYSRAMQQEVASDAADLFTPSYSTAQITGANAKDKDYSITPSKAGFTVDLRTLPHEHDTRVHELRRLITEFGLEEGATVRISELDNFEGTLTAPDSPIVRLAESVTRLVAQGFNGGDEGEVLRSKGMEGITLGPGEFIYAHTANEQISVDSVLNAIDIYAHIFRKSTNLL